MSKKTEKETENPELEETLARSSHMDLEDFLTELRSMSSQVRWSNKQPGCIRGELRGVRGVPGVYVCPITGVYLATVDNGTPHAVHEWADAAHKLGLSHSLALQIMHAADSLFNTYDKDLRKQLLRAVNLSDKL